MALPRTWSDPWLRTAVRSFRESSKADGADVSLERKPHGRKPQRLDPERKPHGQALPSWAPLARQLPVTRQPRWPRAL